MILAECLLCIVQVQFQQINSILILLSRFLQMIQQLYMLSFLPLTLLQISQSKESESKATVISIMQPTNTSSPSPLLCCFMNLPLSSHPPLPCLCICQLQIFTSGSVMTRHAARRNQMYWKYLIARIHQDKDQRDLSQDHKILVWGSVGHSYTTPITCQVFPVIVGDAWQPRSE